MFDSILKSETILFIDKISLYCVWIESITWKDERAAFVVAEGLYSQKHSVDKIVNGVTIDLVHGCGDRLHRDHKELVLSMVDIYDVEKTMHNPVIMYPNDEDRLMISISFKCTLEFSEDWVK